jgi:hypothetical protein
MATKIYPLKLSPLDRRLFGQAARAEGKPLSQWLREAGRERARNLKRRAACLDYPDKVELSEQAERNPKAFIRSRLKKAA